MRPLAWGRARWDPPNALENAPFLRLRNEVMHYAWGSHTALADLLGRAAPSAEPEAELWMGAHPSAPSRVQTDGGDVALDAWIARDPGGVLGAGVARRFDGRLPFLLKVLAVDRPLSIQAHPDLAQARAGFARENEAGIPLDAPLRCYRDENHKPELICALTPFRALNRFRETTEIVRGFRALGAADLDPLIDALAERPDADGMCAFFAGLMTLDPDARSRVIACAAARVDGSDEPALRWCARLLAAHPGDVGALAPLLLNLVELAPGEAMFLPAGELHSYLEGVGIELMASSDNVLRGGLTPKHVDVPELLRTLTGRSGPVEVLRPRARSEGLADYDTPVSEFALSVLTVAPGGGAAVSSRRGVEILLCTRGSVDLVAGADVTPLARGDSALVPASTGPYRVEGNGTLYRASPGAA